MVEQRPRPQRPRIVAWLGWGALAAIGYAIGVPLLFGGVALFPIAIVAYEGGAGEAAIASAAGMFGVALLNAHLSLPAIGLFAAGTVLGLGLRREQGMPWFLAAGVVALVSMVGIVTLPPALGGSLRVTPADMRSIGQLYGLTGSQATQVVQQALDMIPALVPIYAVLLVVEGFYFTRWRLAANGKQIQPGIPFTHWQAPPWLAPLYLLALGAQAVLALIQAPDLPQRWATYALVWTEIPLGVFGLAILTYLLVRLRVPLVLRIVIPVLMLLIPPLAMIFICVGIVDNISDLRHIRGANT
jgi:hypothetical protein